MNSSPTNWRAEIEGRILHISGVAKYPNDFSTAGLERLKSDEPSILCYRLIFNRDKEPYCDRDGIGPVHHFERDFSYEAKSIRVFIEAHSIDFTITQK